MFISGFVTTTRVTHATPGALYAHVNNRDWECETAIPREHRKCVKDIARQLVEEAPGKNFKVIKYFKFILFSVNFYLKY